MKVIGLMSGTSLDGIDAALLDLKRTKRDLTFRLLDFETYPFPGTVREKILDLSNGNETTPLISHVNYLLGELFAESSRKIARRGGFLLNQIDLIGSHGQTIWHSTERVREGRYRIRTTFQIGEPSVIAVRTGVTTVGDFRPADVAAGGQGAPLAPYFHRVIAGRENKSRLILNIGGISNVTFLPRSSKGKVLAFDTGPGNVLIDGMIRKITRGRETYDRDGRFAERGTIHEPLLRKLMSHPFIERKPPKSTGRETFGDALIETILREKRRLSDEDAVATLTAFTAFSIYLNCKRFILGDQQVDEMIVGGGGARNRSLMRLLKAYFDPVPVLSFDRIGLNGKAIEAMAFALFAFDSLLGIPVNIPSVTGAGSEVILGKIAPGKNYRRLLSKVCGTIPL
jgi:anhydro-N-acetylmuramic acid kinase